MSLSPQQIRAAELLSKGHSHQEVGDAVGVSRRTVLRWLKQEDFKNLSYGLVGRTPQPAPHRPPERRQQKSTLTPEDLVEDALVAVQGILVDPEARTCDRLKAAALVGEWAGIGSVKNKMAEMEALKLLIDANWVPDGVLVALVEGSKDLEESIKNAFHSCYEGNENEHKKALLHVSEGGTFTDKFDELDNKNE